MSSCCKIVKDFQIENNYVGQISDVLCSSFDFDLEWSSIVDDLHIFIQIRTCDVARLRNEFRLGVRRMIPDFTGNNYRHNFVYRTGLKFECSEYITFIHHENVVIHQKIPKNVTNPMSCGSFHLSKRPSICFNE
jgi:hypothetical protein